MAKIEPTMTIHVDCDDFKRSAERFAESFDRFERAFYERFAVPSALLGGEDVGALKATIAVLKQENERLRAASAEHEHNARILSDAFNAAKERAAKAEVESERLRNRPASLQKADNVIAELRRKLAEATGTTTFNRAESYDALRKQRDEARSAFEDRAARLLASEERVIELAEENDEIRGDFATVRSERDEARSFAERYENLWRSCRFEVERLGGVIESLAAERDRRVDAAARLVVEFEPGMHGREFRERLADEVRKLKG